MNALASSRAAAIVAAGLTAVVSLGAFAQDAAKRPDLPAITKPVLFNTPEADRILSALQVLPPDSPWNQDVSGLPVAANSAKLIATIGADKQLRYNQDMCFILVPPDQPKVPVKLGTYDDESDPGPYPVPDNTPVEDWPVNKKSLEAYQREKGGDRHAIVVDPTNRMLYEFYHMQKTDAGWTSAQASIFDLKTNKLRPDGWTSADAAGLPIFPAVVRYDEVERGLVDHAMRFTVRRTRRAYVAPATHFASRSNDASLPRMGERFRLRQDYDVSGFSPHVQAILKGLKKHGMFVADNGSDWFLSVAPDERIQGLNELRRVHGRDFEVVATPGDRGR